MQSSDRYNKLFNTSFWINISASTYLGIVRNALTLTLPIVIAGAAAVLINNFPIESYQRLMVSIFGPGWRLFGGYVWNGTLAVLSPVMTFSIGHSIAEHYNAKHPLDVLHPIIVGLVSFCSLMAIVEPTKEVFAVPYQWIGIHGMFLAIVVAVISSRLFLLLYGLRILRVRFYSEEASATVVGTFSSLIPGMLTIFAFAGLKVLSLSAEIPDLHRLIYDFLYLPFKGMGNTVWGAILYNFARQLLWFVGIHGSNALEPVMTEVYVNAMRANEFAMIAGEPLPFIFTKTFFDCFVSIGGAGATLSLILALAVRRHDDSMMRIGKISLLPALFNINETLLFGLPIVLNPIFFVPFLLVPIVSTLTSYYAMLWGLVPIPTVSVEWTTPALIGGIVATGSLSGGLLQLFNLFVGTVVYLPFVRIAESVQQHKFRITYAALLDASGELGEASRASLVNRTDDVGSVSRALANDLLRSIRRRELFLEYQPQVDSRTGYVVGVEALLRWMHPRIGRIPPSLFIPLAEEIGFIDEIGLWVCDESCRQLREWQDKGLSETVMSFNVSVKQLDDPMLPQKILGYIEKYRLDPGDVKAEVTESTGLSADMGHNLVIQEIRMSGVRIAIDDFGMGHTSIVYLKKFPVTTIKLDGSLVRDVVTDKVSAEIIGSMSELSRSMKIELLAEYVETPEQAMRLNELGCSVFQGYLYSPSLSPEACEHAIRTGFRPYGGPL